MFKGGALGVGAGKLASLCQKAQHMQEGVDVRKALFGQIQTEYERVKTELGKLGLIG